LRVRFLTDQNLNADIVSGVLRRLPEIDFETAYEAGLESASDAELLTFAAKKAKFLSLTIARQCRSILVGSLRPKTALAS
jgi:hypothetical protein